jgi:hypothetical protein
LLGCVSALAVPRADFSVDWLLLLLRSIASTTITIWKKPSTSRSWKRNWAGPLSSSVAQHKEFIPELLKLKEYLENVKAGKETYNGSLLVESINSFSDVMVEHLR